MIKICLKKGRYRGPIHILSSYRIDMRVSMKPGSLTKKFNVSAGGRSEAAKRQLTD
jgi:hypothetical protein